MHEKTYGHINFISVDIYILYILYILGKDEYKKTEICRCIDFSSNFKCSFAELKSADGAQQRPPLPEYFQQCITVPTSSRVFLVVHYNHWSSGNSKPRPLVLSYTVQKFFPKIELKRKTFQDFSEILVFGKFNNIKFLDCVYASRLLPFFWIFLNSVQPEMPRKEVQQIFPTTTKYE